MITHILPNMTNVALNGVHIEILNIIWMLFETTVSICAGITACSTLLAAFGIDSIIEIITGTDLLWRLLIGAKVHSDIQLKRAGYVAHWIVNMALYPADQQQSPRQRCRL
jgi:hypothetical protein